MKRRTSSEDGYAMMKTGIALGYVATAVAIILLVFCALRAIAGAGLAL